MSRTGKDEQEGQEELTTRGGMGKRRIQQ